jgi:hypothetical protein
MRAKFVIHDAYKRPLVWNASLQPFMLLFTSLILDGGFAFAFTMIAVAAYWGSIIVMLVRNPKNPTKGNLIWARRGFILTLPIEFAVGFAFVLVDSVISRSF